MIFSLLKTDYLIPSLDRQNRTTCIKFGALRVLLSDNFINVLCCIFRLNSQSGDGSRLEQYQGSSPDRDSSTDFDDLDVDDKSFEEDDDEKIDIENEDDSGSIASPVSLTTSTVTPPTPQISPT